MGVIFSGGPMNNCVLELEVDIREYRFPVFDDEFEVYSSFDPTTVSTRKTANYRNTGIKRDDWYIFEFIGVYG